MVNSKAVKIIQEKIEELESIRDQLLPLAPGANIDPIFEKIDEYYKKLLKELGYDDSN